MTHFSQNGWEYGNEDLVAVYTVPGSEVRLRVRKGDAAYLLLKIAAFVDQHVENIDTRSGVKGFDVPDDWSYATRPIRGSETLSNHGSGTAIDVNAVQHPLAVKNTWSAAERQLVHDFLKANFRDKDTGVVVIRWGEDYISRTDGMHFEINAGAAAVGRVADALRKKEEELDVDEKTLRKIIRSEIIDVLKTEKIVPNKPLDGTPATTFWTVAGVLAAADQKLDNANLKQNQIIEAAKE